VLFTVSVHVHSVCSCSPQMMCPTCPSSLQDDILKQHFTHGAVLMNWSCPSGSGEDQERIKWRVRQYEKLAEAMACMPEDYKKEKASMVRPEEAPPLSFLRHVGRSRGLQFAVLCLATLRCTAGAVSLEHSLPKSA
jgi:hypothetical protein